MIESSPCYSMDYAYAQLQNYKNGILDLGEGIFDFYGHFYLDDEQVIIRGMGSNRTTLQFMKYFNILIGCSWHKCWIEMSDLSLSTGWNEDDNYGNYELIHMEKGGTLLFEQVVFDGNNFYISDESFWYFSGFETFAIFKKCEFTHNDVQSFEVTMGANVEFIDCSFVNNELTDDKTMFNVNKYATVTFEDCLFEYNTFYGRNAFFSYSHGSDLIFDGCKFNQNKGNGHFMYAYAIDDGLNGTDTLNIVQINDCQFGCFDVQSIFANDLNSASNIFIHHSVFSNNSIHSDYAMINFGDEVADDLMLNELFITDCLFMNNVQSVSIKYDYANVRISNSMWIDSTFDDGVFRGFGDGQNGYFELNEVTLGNINGRGLVAMNDYRSYKITNSHFESIGFVHDNNQFGAVCISMIELFGNVNLGNNDFINCNGMIGALYLNQVSNQTILSNLSFLDNFGLFVADFYLNTSHEIEVNGIWNISQSNGNYSVYMQSSSENVIDFALNDWNFVNISTQIDILFVDNINLKMTHFYVADNTQNIIFSKASNLSVHHSKFINNEHAIFKFDESSNDYLYFYVFDSMFDRNQHQIIDGNADKMSILFQNCSFVDSILETPLLNIAFSNDSMQNTENQRIVRFDDVIFENILCQTAMVNVEQIMTEFNRTTFKQNTNCSFHFDAYSVSTISDSDFFNNIGTIFSVQNARRFDLINTKISHHIGNVITYTNNANVDDFAALIKKCHFVNIRSAQEHGVIFVENTYKGLNAMNVSLIDSVFENNTNSVLLNVIGTHSEYTDVSKDCPDFESYSILVDSCQFYDNLWSKQSSNVPFITLSWSRVFVIHSIFKSIIGYNAIFKNSLSSLSIDANNSFRGQYNAQNPIIYVNDAPFSSIIPIEFSICLEVASLNETEFIQTNGNMQHTKVKFECIDKMDLTQYGTTRYEQILAEINQNYTKYANNSDDSLKNLESAAMALGIYNCSKEAKFCFIECFAQISCFGATFDLSSMISNYLFCGNFFSCSNAVIYAHAHSSSNVSILCNKESACQNAKIYVNNQQFVVLECIEFNACSFVEFIGTNVDNILITCYDTNACFELTVISDQDSIIFNIFHYSTNVEIYAPLGYENKFDCNPNDAYFYYDGQSSFEETLRSNVYIDDESMLPCEGLMVFATDISANASIEESECKFTPRFDKNVRLENEINFYAQPYFECFWLVEVENILSYGCVQDPTFAPSQSPVAAPTKDTLSPSLIPTRSPSNDPSIAPSANPTFSPTNTPTNIPTNAPSQSPTSSPTRMVINHDEFEYFMQVKFEISGLYKAQFDDLVQNIDVGVLNLTAIIEDGYFNDGILHYRDFWCKVLKINHFAIEDINSAILLNEKFYIAQSGKHIFESTIIVMDVLIECDDVPCNYMTLESKGSSFPAKMTANLQKMYQNNTNISFAVLNTDLLSTQCKISYCPTQQSIDWALIGIGTFCAILCVIAIFAFLFNNEMFPNLSPFEPVDNGDYAALIILSLQIWDFCSDLNLSIEILLRPDFDDNILILIAGVFSIFFIFIPYVGNLIIAANVKHYISTNEAAKAWFNENVAVFVMMVVLSGGCYPALAVISSRIFGMSLFSCGLTQFELKKLSKIKVFATVVLENIPQLCSQALYAYAINDISEGIILAFTASLLSVTASTLSYWIGRDVSDTVPVEYYLSIQCNKRSKLTSNQTTNVATTTTTTTNSNNHLKINHSKQLTFEYSVSRSLSSSDSNHDETEPPKEGREEGDNSTEITVSEKANFVSNRGKKWKIGKDLSEVFGIPHENIEVGHGMLNKYGLILHIVHYVYLKDLSMMEEELQSIDVNGITPIYFVKQLYLTFEQEINKVFVDHFKLNNDFTTTFSKSMSVKNEKHKTLLNLLAGVEDADDAKDKNEEKITKKTTKMTKNLSRYSTMIKHTELSILQRVALQATHSAQQSMMSRQIEMSKNMEYSRQIELQPMDLRLAVTPNTNSGHLSISTQSVMPIMQLQMDNDPSVTYSKSPVPKSRSNTPSMALKAVEPNKRYRLKITDIDFSEKIAKDIKSLTPPEIVQLDTKKIDEKFGDAAKQIMNDKEEEKKKEEENEDEDEIKEVEHMVTQTLSSIGSNVKLTGIDSINSVASRTRALSTIDEEDGDEQSKESLDLGSILG